MNSKLILPLMLLAVVVAVVAAAAMSLTGGQQNQAPAEPVEWEVWARDVAAEAAATGKPILMLFTGSDWCGPCIQQESRVFTTERFRKWAEENVVLWKLDFPRQTKQPEELEAQNKTLGSQLGIRGFPTMVVLTPSGEAVQRFSYTGVGVDAWIDQAQPLVDAARARAEQETAADSTTP